MAPPVFAALAAPLRPRSASMDIPRCAGSSASQEKPQESQASQDSFCFYSTSPTGVAFYAYESSTRSGQASRQAPAQSAPGIFGRLFASVQ
ncbi:hypothetical protein TSOC_007153 [Tetrabaena socialis]|uniref:Uncharacterized protein n=1 Tax=Tetrabaena socialis TaxID=47790 RepID=A0A2J8A1X0_9CHLO|nr:hypothetical protein TSOC_007153 [Tetrabaena socialis]|eukprot:PNH06512.1 hypothetical protein TSOC_007153 [Tetrabaena socialis]